MRKAYVISLVSALLIGVLLSNLPLGLCVAQDYTTFTEVDPNSVITVQSSTQIYANLQRDKTAYVYYDGGADAYGDFSAEFDRQGLYLSSGGVSCEFMVANSVGDMRNLQDTSGYSLMFYSVGQSSQYVTFSIRENDGGTLYTDTTASTFNTVTLWYITLEKNGEDFTAEIYSDASRTSLQESLSLTLHDDMLAYRYLYAVASYNDGGSSYYNRVYVRNLDVTGVTPSDTYYIEYDAGSFEQNTTELLDTANFTATWTTNGTLSHSIFSWNFSGAYVNDTAQAFGGSVSTTLKYLGDNVSTIGYNVGVIMYANTTTGEWDTTGVNYFTVTYASSGGEDLTGFAVIAVVGTITFMLIWFGDNKK